jgi:HEAT repeat protein
MPLVRKPSPIATVPPGDASFGGENLAAVLLHGSDDERWRAARTAANAPDGLAMLNEAVSRENHPRVLEAIFTGLARLHTAESAEVILRYLRSDDSSLRTLALDALGTMPDAVTNHLPCLLKDDDADVRLLACELLRKQPAAVASAMLGELLATDREANVCAAAIEVLAETGGPELVPLLSRCAARFPSDPFLAFAVQAARERIGLQATNRG